MPDTVDNVLASDVTWRIVRGGLEDSLTDTQQAVQGGTLWAWLERECEGC